MLRKYLKYMGIGVIIGMMLPWGCGPEMPVEEEEEFIFSGAGLEYDHRLRSMNMHVRVESAEGVTGVRAELTDPRDSVWNIELNDGGQEGDIIAGDGVWAYTLNYGAVLDSSEGELRAVLIGEYGEGKVSEELVVSAYFRAVNGLPVIVEIDMPDSVQLPTSGTKLVNLRAWVNDPDGVEDILSLSYEVLNLTDSSWVGNAAFVLRDVDPDPAAGNGEVDGYFTSTVTVSSTNRPVVNHFRYMARDKAGNLSEAIIDSIRLYR